MSHATCAHAANLVASCDAKVVVVIYIFVEVIHAGESSCAARKRHSIGSGAGCPAVVDSAAAVASVVAAAPFCFARSNWSSSLLCSSFTPMDVRSSACTNKWRARGRRRDASVTLCGKVIACVFAHEDSSSTRTVSACSRWGVSAPNAKTASA